MAMPPSGEKVRVPSLVSGFAKLIRYRCNELGAFADEGNGKTPVVDALIGLKEPKTGPDGTLSWTVDVINHNTGDDCVLFLKELVMPDGERRPYSMWLSGVYPHVLDGLCKALSLDMRVCDLAWIGMKLRKLLNYAETNGSFMARIPGSDKAQTWPSTIAYLAQLMIHRYAMLGLLTEEGYPVAHVGILDGASGRAGEHRGAQTSGRQEVPGVREQNHDPQGRLRFLHGVWSYRSVRLRPTERLKEAQPIAAGEAVAIGSPLLACAVALSLRHRIASLHPASLRTFAARAWALRR